MNLVNMWMPVLIMYC